MLSWIEAKRVLLSPAVISVLIVVGLWNFLTSSESVAHATEGPGVIRETLADVRDLNVRLQLRMYQLIFRLLPHRALSAKWVTLVLIGDEAHWATLHGNTPTDRSYLAKLITNVSTNHTAKAAAIGLDIELLSPVGLPGADDPARAEQNADLLKAIKAAVANGVPVVLASAYGSQKNGTKIRLPGVFEDSQLPIGGCDSSSSYSACALVGYINAPQDRREIPLVESVSQSDHSSSFAFRSFALAVVDAHERGRGTTTRRDILIANAINSREPLLGTFLPELAFQPTINADDLFKSDAAAINSCANRIVLIGGKWHELPGAFGGAGYGSFVDTHISPVGVIPGLVFHANYIESLKTGLFRPLLPFYLGVIVDLVVGVGIYLAYEMLKGWRKFCWLLLAFLSVPFVAYVFFVFANRYLDFLLPIELYFLHLGYESIRGLWATS